MRKKNIIGILLSIFIPILAIAQTSDLRFDPAKTSKAGGSYLLRLAPKPGETFHHRVTVKTQVSIKNSDDLFKLPTIKADDKAGELLTYYVTTTVRSRRADATTDFLCRIDSLHAREENNGESHVFTSTSTSDLLNPLFQSKGAFAGHDFGVIIDTLGGMKDIYAYYEISDYLFGNLDDSLQTSEEETNSSNQAYEGLKNVFNYLVAYLSVKPPQSDSSYRDEQTEDYTVWGSVSFPMKKDYKSTFDGFEESGDRIYAKYDEERTMTPVERFQDDSDYKMTLPNYTYSKKSTYYIDVATGMIAYDKWTKDEVFGLKIESKSPETAGKSFVTVQRTKVEATVERLK